MVMSPGTYLRKRREAASLSILDLALATETDPAICARDRGEWIGMIERDEAPIAGGFVEALRQHPMFGFSPAILIVLVRIHAGDADVVEPAVCRVCACSWNDACSDDSGEACGWSKDPTLCTMCIGKEAVDRYDEAVEVLRSAKQASTSRVQRALRIGYNEAVAYVERMQAAGLVSSPNRAGARTWVGAEVGR